MANKPIPKSFLEVLIKAHISHIRNIQNEAFLMLRGCVLFCHNKKAIIPIMGLSPSTKFQYHSLGAFSVTKLFLTTTHHKISKIITPININAALGGNFEGCNFFLKGNEKKLNPSRREPNPKQVMAKQGAYSESVGLQ